MAPECLDAEVLAQIKRRRSEAFLARLIDLFLQESPARIGEAWEGGKAKDWRKVELAAHILRCLAENMGARAIRDRAPAAEAACSGNRGTNVYLAHILFDLEIAFAETRFCLLIAREGLSRA